MAVHAAVELIAGRSPDAWLDKVHKINPVYGRRIRANRTLPTNLNYRFQDGIAYYRKAVEADPRLWSDAFPTGN